MSNSVRIAVIGLGEVGTAFSRGFLEAGGFEVAVFDILLRDEPAREALAVRARSVGARLCESAAEAAEGAMAVISAVTASSAFSVAEEAATYMKPGQFFLDVNSVSPETKRRDGEAVEASGADYVEAAVMAPVAPYGLSVPIVLGGRRAASLKDLLEPAGMRLEVGEREIGKASALKMCRSIMVKGLEALAVECLTAARLYGVEEKVLASLGESYRGIEWESLAGYNIGRTVAHGARRAAEMREAAATVAETGLSPVMTSATAERIEWVAARVEARPGLKAIKDGDWRVTIDAMADDAKLRRLPGK